MSILSYREALNQGIAEELERDSNVVLMGEEVANLKLLQSFGRSFGKIWAFQNN